MQPSSQFRSSWSSCWHTGTAALISESASVLASPDQPSTAATAAASICLAVESTAEATWDTRPTSAETTWSTSPWTAEASAWIWFCAAVASCWPSVFQAETSPVACAAQSEPSVV